VVAAVVVCKRIAFALCLRATAALSFADGVVRHLLAVTLSRKTALRLVSMGSE